MKQLTQWLAILWFAGVSSPVCTGQGMVNDLTGLHRNGTEAFQRGDFIASIDFWKEARELAESEKRPRTEVSILVNLAQAYQGIGNPALAFHSLDAAEILAAELGDETLRLEVRGVRGGLAALGDDARFRKMPAMESPSDGSARAWTLAGLEALLAEFKSSAFGKPGAAQVREAREYFRKHRQPGLRDEDGAELRSDFDPKMKAVAGFIAVRNRRSFSGLKRVKDWLDKQPANNGLEAAKMYRELSVQLDVVAREILSDPAERNEARALVAVTEGSAEAIEKSLTPSSALANRSGGAGRSFLAGADGRVMTERDREMMRVLARNSLPDLIEDARFHLEMLETEGAASGETAIERIDADAGLRLLSRADELAESLLEPELALEIKLSLGAWMAFIGGAGEAGTDAGAKPEAELLAAWATARRSGNSGLEAAQLNDLGVSLSARGRDAVSRLCFSRGAQHAEKSGDRELSARALVNRAKASGEAADLAGAMAEVKALPASHAKSVMLLSLGESYAERSEAAQSYPLYKEALAIGRSNQNDWGRSHALGLLGDLYLEQGRLDEALSLTRRALFLAQGETVRSQDLVFRWTWQSGRLLAKQGRLEALDSYTRAEAVLAAIRQDLVVGYGRRGEGSNFREAVGPFYFELADLYFDRARSGPETRQGNLEQARSAIERFKAAMLEDYFRDRSITNYRQAGIGKGDRRVLEGPKRPAGMVASHAGATAVLYLVPMEERTEILLDLDNKLSWATADAGRKSLEQAADDLRFALDPHMAADTASDAYLGPARRLYDQLIRPFRKQLDDANVETLVIVPDGKLRSVPMSVLHDGDGYLVERFSLAVLPDLSLIPDERRQRTSGKKKPLLAGLSLPVQGFAALPGVEGEIEQIREFDRKAPVLLNENFSKQSFAASFRNDFDLVHIASHANFSTDLDQTFVLTYEDTIGPSDLEKSVRQLAFRDRAVDLLVLSACETAVGDDRAALGLAGIAVKSGAHSVMASLWAVDDASTRELVTSFYESFLPEDPGLSKAQALQEAQLKILRNSDNPEWKHPRYWAPFTVIGNWLAPEERLRIDDLVREEISQPKLSDLD